jgi:hypothetical protein
MLLVFMGSFHIHFLFVRADISTIRHNTRRVHRLSGKSDTRKDFSQNKYKRPLVKISYDDEYYCDIKLP